MFGWSGVMEEMSKENAEAEARSGKSSCAMGNAIYLLPLCPPFLYGVISRHTNHFLPPTHIYLNPSLQNNQWALFLPPVWNRKVSPGSQDLWVWGLDHQEQQEH